MIVGIGDDSGFITASPGRANFRAHGGNDGLSIAWSLPNDPALPLAHLSFLT